MLYQPNRYFLVDLVAGSSFASNTRPKALEQCLRDVREGPMTNIVEQCGQLQYIPFVRLRIQFRGELACDVEYTYRVIEPCMNGTWVQQVRIRELPDSAQPLNDARIEHLGLDTIEAHESVYGISNFHPNANRAIDLGVFEMRT